MDLGYGLGEVRLKTPWVHIISYNVETAAKVIFETVFVVTPLFIVANGPEIR
jgi:hypothetical protein